MGALPHRHLHLGRIGFLNVLPIYYPLENGIIAHPFSIISGTPAELNELMARGELDVSVVSSIEYARHPERYFILPNLSISCCGPVGSVLLLSRVPIHELNGRPILASTQSHTSVALLKVLLGVHAGVRTTLEPGRCTEALQSPEPPTAMLVIGDEALRLREHPLYPYQWDLGKVWHDWTGLPFVFALWVIQRQAIERWNGSLKSAVETLAASRAWGEANREFISREAARRGILDVDGFREYYRGLAYGFDRDEQKGLELFFRYLMQIGEIEAVPELEIYSPLACVA